LLRDIAVPRSPTLHLFYSLHVARRPELPLYGQDQVNAPHLTALAARGLTFDRAFCQVSPSHPFPPIFSGPLQGVGQFARLMQVLGARI